MNNEELKQTILSILPSAVFEDNTQFLSIQIPAEQIHDFAKKIKESETISFDYLFCLTGIDYGDSLGVIYHLRSTKYRHEIVVKIKTSDRETTAVDTVCDIFKTAEFHEREIFDLFGIKFNHHPDLRRILLDESWEGYPLRKDYIDEVNIVER